MLFGWSLGARIACKVCCNTAGSINVMGSCQSEELASSLALMCEKKVGSKGRRDFYILMSNIYPCTMP